METRSQFIEQVQILMEVQQIKSAERIFGKSNYMWLCNKKAGMIWMSTKDEFKIRQALHKLSADDQNQVMKRLLTWLDDHPDAHTLKIPEVTLAFLNELITGKILMETSFSRMNSFRSSLRRFSIRSNKIAPSDFLNNQRASRTVTFNDEPKIYRIPH